jgi:two-component system NarL family response regulator
MTEQELATRVGVLIADDHPIVRMGFAGIVERQQDMRLVAHAADGMQAVALFDSLRPDVVFMDLRMPELDGVEAIKRIRQIDPDARIIILTTFDGEDAIYRGLRAGARGYLLKDASEVDIVNCVHAIMQGQTFLKGHVASRLFGRMQEEALSPRESEVLRWLAQGESNKEIARQIGVTEGTVKFHVAAIMAKFSAKSRTEAVLVAMKRGLIDLS